MGACQNQFQNVPDIDEASLEDQLEQERERQRFTSKSIKLPHKTCKPNSKQVKIGMIHSNSNKTMYYHSLQERDLQALSVNSNAQSDQPYYGKIDREQLHRTTRPFEKEEQIQIPENEIQYIVREQKERKELNLDFYYSLGLSEYTYRQIPKQYQHEYDKKSIQMKEQEERNGVRYIGEWRDSQLHGNGVLKSNTVKYIGQFRLGLKYFHGREIETDQVYEGEFKDGRRKGWGIRYTEDKTEIGQFDQYLTQGIIRYANGDYFIGNLQTGRYHGINCKFYEKQNKILYLGNYHLGKMQGAGKIIYLKQELNQLNEEDEKILENIEQDKSIDKYRYYFDEQKEVQEEFNEQEIDKYYHGGMMNGLKHGEGLFKWDQKNYYLGEYKRGKKHGKGKLCREGRNYQGTFKNGMMHGQMQVWKDNDRRMSRIEKYNNGKLQEEQQYSVSNDDLPQGWKRAV